MARDREVSVLLEDYPVDAPEQVPRAAASHGTLLASGPWAAGFRGRRILLLTPNPDLTTNPTLVSLLTGLIQCGAEADVLLPDPGQSWGGDYAFPPAHAELARCTFGLPELLATESCSAPHLAGLARRLAEGAYDLVFGVDPEGAIRAHRFAERHGLPFVYISFEVFFWDELNSEEKVAHKQDEWTASHAAAFVIVQDHWRGALLAEQNGLNEEQLEYVPVAPCSFPPVTRSDALRRRFGIAANKTLVLHAGSFDSWTYAAELLESVPAWPDEFVLVVHTRYRPDPNEEFAILLREAHGDRVLVDLEPLPADDYERLVASADIGLVLYKSIADEDRWESHYLQKNLQVIGLSSGKFSCYLKCGLPVVSVAQDAFDELLTEYGFGENVPTVDDIPAALGRIKANLAEHRAEAQRLFAERLAFEVHWPRLARRLQEAMTCGTTREPPL